MTNNPPAQQRTFPEYHSEDEVSLMDLALVLARRWALVLGVVMVCVVIGVILAAKDPVIYQFQTSIEIGTHLRATAEGGSQQVLLEPPPTMLAKIQESYIPQVRQNYMGVVGKVGDIPEIEARIPTDGQIIILKSMGALDGLHTHTLLHEAVVRAVLEDHERVMTIVRKDKEIEHQRAIDKLEELKGLNDAIKGQYSRLDDARALILKQITVARANLQQFMLDRKAALANLTNGSQAMVLMLVDREIQSAQDRIAELEERVVVRLGEEQDKLSKSLADNHRAQVAQTNVIAKQNLLLSNLHETRALNAPMRSLEPVRSKKPMLIGLSLVLGLVLGVFGAFFVEFVGKVRGRMNSVEAI